MIAQTKTCLPRNCSHSILCVLLAATALLAEDTEQRTPQPTVTRPKVLVTVSPETTGITKPLREDGYPDYIAAINQLASQGVTPESNASVLFWQAAGPASLDAGIRERFWKKLGILPLPDTGDYWVPLNEFVKKHPELANFPQHLTGQARYEAQMNIAFDQELAARSGPWKPEEYPMIATWLKENEKPLQLVVKGTNRPHRYEPRVATNGDRMLFDTASDGTILARNLSYPLLCRAMLNAGKNDFASAQRDLAACHRMANLLCRSRWFLDVLVGTAIHTFAFDAEQGWLQREPLSKTHLDKLQEMLNGNVIAPHWASNIDISERWMLCDAICNGAASGKPFPMDLMDEPTKNKAFAIMKAIAAAKLDYDIMLKYGNGWYDRCVKILLDPDRAKRLAELEKFDRDLDKLVEDTKGRLFTPVFLGSTAETSEWVASIYVITFVTSMRPMAMVQDRFSTRRDIVSLGIALAKYKHDHDQFPQQLAQLMPKYATQIPKDIFSGNELIYTTNGAGYLLYSVGQNGQDDSGRTYADSNNAIKQENKSVDWDDLSLRVPRTGSH